MVVYWEFNSRISISLGGKECNPQTNPENIQVTLPPIEKMRETLIILLIINPLLGFSQKFMIEKGDTVPYKLEMHISGTDTSYYDSCNTFIIKNNEIINKEVNCVRRGYWEVENDNGTISKGNYNSKGSKIGIWKTYEINGQLKEEIEYASIGNDLYVLKDVQYKNGQEIIIKEKTWIAKFYLKHLLIICIILGISFFSRVFFNSTIYNRKNGTSYSPIYFFIGTKTSDNFGHSIACTFTFWWNVKKLREENKQLAIASNVLSIIALGLFFGIIIGLGFSGELN